MSHLRKISKTTQHMKEINFIFPSSTSRNNTASLALSTQEKSELEVKPEEIETLDIPQSLERLMSKEPEPVDLLFQPHPSSDHSHRREKIITHELESHFE